MSTESIINTGVSQSSINLRLGNGAMTGMTKGALPNGTIVDIMPDAPSLLEQIMEMAEEIGMASDEGEEDSVEEANRDIDDAFVREKGTLASIVQVGRFMEQMRRSYTGAQLESLAKRILQRAGSAAQMREMLEEEFGGDAAAQHMMLQFIIAYSQDRGESEERQRMAYEAMLEIEEDNKGGRTALLASINAAKEGYSYGKTTEEVQLFCGAYKEAILDSGNLSDVLQTVLSLVYPRGSDMMKAQNIKTYLDVIQRLIRALGDDMAAIRPSKDPVKLKVLLADLNRLQTLNTLLENCRTFSVGMEKHFSVVIEATRLMQELIAISVERWVTEDRFSRMPPQYEVRGHKPKVVFLTGVKRVLGDVPVHIFADFETRTTTMAAAIEALNSAVIEEEEAEENRID